MTCEKHHSTGSTIGVPRARRSRRLPANSIAQHSAPTLSLDAILGEMPAIEADPFSSF